VPAVWALSVLGIVIVNAVEAFRLPGFLSRPLRQLPRRRGLLGSSSFTAVQTFRYTALRMLSYGLDIAPGGVGSVHAQPATMYTPTRARARPLDFTMLALKRYLAYCVYSPLRVSGPIITFDTYGTLPRDRTYPAHLSPFLTSDPNLAGGTYPGVRCRRPPTVPVPARSGPKSS